MDTARSRFVVARMRSHSGPEWREYLEDLLRIEGYVLSPPSTWGAGCGSQRLRQRYRADYEAIERELASPRPPRHLRLV